MWVPALRAVPPWLGAPTAATDSGSSSGSVSLASTASTLSRLSSVTVKVSSTARGSSLSSTMVSTAVMGVPNIAQTGLDRVRLTVSAGSSTSSSTIGTSKVWLVRPGVKVSVPVDVR